MSLLVRIVYCVSYLCLLSLASKQSTLCLFNVLSVVSIVIVPILYAMSIVPQSISVPTVAYYTIAMYSRVG